jgi:hypothetical protein
MVWIRAKAAWVLGELTALGLIKQQFGAKILRKINPWRQLKSAASDCLKKLQLYSGWDCICTKMNYPEKRLNLPKLNHRPMLNQRATEKLP